LAGTAMILKMQRRNGGKEHKADRLIVYFASWRSFASLR
jgi:hypothetical protein